MGDWRAENTIWGGKALGGGKGLRKRPDADAETQKITVYERGAFTGP